VAREYQKYFLKPDRRLMDIRLTVRTNAAMELLRLDNNPFAHDATAKAQV
jgi:hypothetical protein